MPQYLRIKIWVMSNTIDRGGKCMEAMGMVESAFHTR